jgi:hypothetical protein
MKGFEIIQQGHILFGLIGLAGLFLLFISPDFGNSLFRGQDIETGFFILI